MCGICCILGCGDNSLSNSLHDIKKVSFICARGPDLHGTKTIEVHQNIHLHLAGFVLHLRGVPTQQPLVNDDGDCLLWNGEVFGGLRVKSEENDTQVVFSKLTNCDCVEDILRTFENIEGPWAFIYWQSKKKKIWFGRDMFGRRSLLWHLPRDRSDIFALSSVRIQPHDFYEIPSVGMYCLDMQGDNWFEDGKMDLTLFPWKSAVWAGSKDRVDNSMMLASYIYPENLPNVKFTIDKTSELQSWIPKLNKEQPPADFKCVALNNKTAKDYLCDLLNNNKLMKSASDQLVDILKTAVTKRVNNLPRNETESVSLETMLIENREQENDLYGAKNITHGAYEDTTSGITRHSNVAILFSGGIDSAILTALADRCVPADESIDLLNVAFEQQPRSYPNTLKTGRQATLMDVKDKFNVPDRLTGYTALSELNPQRHWNFVEINVSPDELQDVRSNRVRHLVYPSCTVLDDSIGCAIWFAARGNGILGNGPDKGKHFSSKAKVILCGMGADEQLAGYSRHRSRYSEGKWEGLLEEIEMEIQRISSRNLGRDDRIIGDHGKEARFPFLDEQVVLFLSNLPIHLKAQLDLPRGVGEKLLLRLCAYQLGLYTSSCFPKRAIQFGSRIAKLENKKEKASEKCHRLAD